MTSKLERELAALANAPLSVTDIEMLELEAIETVMHGGDGMRLRQAKLILRATAEIRKRRGIWDATEMTERDIDDEIAMLRGKS
jgi:hypothetical protein